MESSCFLERMRFFYFQADYIKALEIIEENMSIVQGDDMVDVNYFQGSILKALAEEAETIDVKVSYWLGSLECFSRISMGSVYSAILLFNMAEQLGSDLYYKKSLRQAKDGLVLLRQPRFEHLESELSREIQDLEYIIQTTEAMIAVSKTRIGEQKGTEINKIEETRNSSFNHAVNELRSYWMGLNVEIKRNFMNVSTADFKTYVKITKGKEGQQALDQVLTYARKHRKWKLWICRSCLKRFPNHDECTNHLELDHAAKFRPSSANDIPQRISDIWASKISVGVWEPVDTAAAVEMIKNHPTDVKAFAYENGWSKDWPRAVDEDRSKLLKETQLLLGSLCDRKTLSCSIRDRFMHFVVKKLNVAEDTLTHCRLVETPQCICFLGCHELNQILAFLRNIKCERYDLNNDLVSKAVDRFCGGTRFKEKIDVDSMFSTLFLDKRLLQCKTTRFDDEGTIKVFDPNVHYAKARASGDDFMSWLTDYASKDDSFQFPRPIRAHNLGIWVAVLRAVQFTCRNLGTKYEKKSQLLDYDTALTDVRKFCISEDDRRRNLPKDKQMTYKSILCNICEEGDTAKTFSSAVRDVLQEASHPRFESENLSDDDLVLESIEFLKSEVNNKVALIDSKILLIDNSRISMLNNLTKLAVFDYRYYIHHPLRVYLLALLRARFNNT